MCFQRREATIATGAPLLQVGEAVRYTLCRGGLDLETLSAKAVERVNEPPAGLPAAEEPDGEAAGDEPRATPPRTRTHVCVAKGPDGTTDPGQGPAVALGVKRHTHAAMHTPTAMPPGWHGAPHTNLAPKTTKSAARCPE